MFVDYVLPDVEFTVDELAILPDECRYELIDGRLDLWDRAPLSIGAAMTVFRRVPGGGFTVTTSTREVFSVDDPFPVTVNLPRLSKRWPQTFEYAGRRSATLDAG